METITEQKNKKVSVTVCLMPDELEWLMSKAVDGETKSQISRRLLRQLMKQEQN